MPRNKSLPSGRASLAALAVLAVLITAGSLFLARKASAQSLTGGLITTFPPVVQTPLGPDTPGAQNSLIGLLLPAVQRLSINFRVQARMGDGSVAVLSLLPYVEQKSVLVDVFLTQREVGAGSILHVRNRETGDEATAETNSSDVTVRVLPAVQSNGFPVVPIAVGQTIMGFNKVALGDGSVRIPFQYAVDAH